MTFSSLLLVVLVLINAGLLALGLYWLRQLHQRLERIDQEADEVLPKIQPAAKTLAKQLRSQAPTVIAIEILNPMAVAKSRSRLAGPLGSLSPNLIRNRVYDEAIVIVREQLVAQGVEADVRVVRESR